MTSIAEAHIQNRIARYVPPTTPMIQWIDWFIDDYAHIQGENDALREQLAALTSRITMTIR